MGDCLERVNNCLQFLNLCKPKDSTNNRSTDSTHNHQSPDLDSSNKLLDMSKYYTLMLPTRPKINDEIRIKAKLKSRPKDFIINLCVDSVLNDDGEPAMIAFHFKTNFKHHNNGQSSVLLTCKRGPNNWDRVEEIDNTWIDDDGVDEIDVAVKFTKREIQIFSGGSSEYQFGHQFEIHRIDRLQVGGDVDFIEEVALRYKQ